MTAGNDLKTDDRWVTRTAWVIYLGILAICIDSVWRPELVWLLNKADLPAWVQAVGSVLAILVAVALTQRQHHLDLERERLASTAREVELCNRALLVLGWQFEYLSVLREQHLDPFRNSKARHLEMTYTLERDIGSRFELDAPSLAFLVAHGAPQVPFNLLVLDERFRAAIGIVNARSKLCSEQFQGAIERMTVEQFEAHVGPRITDQLRRAADEIYDHIDFAIEDFQRLVDVTRQALSRVYPGHAIIGLPNRKNR